MGGLRPTGVAGVETELGLIVAVGMVGCGGCDGG